MYDFAVDVGQSEVTSRISIGQLFVIQSHEMKDRGVQVMDVSNTSSPATRPAAATARSTTRRFLVGSDWSLLVQAAIATRSRQFLVGSGRTAPFMGMVQVGVEGQSFFSPVAGSLVYGLFSPPVLASYFENSWGDDWSS